MPTRVRRPSEPTGYYEALATRVDTLSADITGVKRDVHELRGTAAMRTDVVGLANKIDNLAEKFTERQRTNWQPIIAAAGVLLSIVVAIGTLAYWPIVSSINELREARLHQYRTEMATFVPRVEIDVMRESYDKELAHLKEAQLDLAKRFGQTYTVRDALDDIQKRIDRMQDIMSAPAMNRRTGGMPGAE